MKKIVIFEDELSIQNSITSLFKRQGIDESNLLNFVSWDQFVLWQNIGGEVEIGVLMLDHTLIGSSLYGDQILLELNNMNLISKDCFIYGISNYEQPYIAGKRCYDCFDKTYPHIKEAVNLASNQFKELQNEDTEISGDIGEAFK